jgi:ribulose-5-phosphate 4-epimerase/fuculose-1-phosphate aldolase
VPDGFLVTPTNSCLGRLEPDRISRLDADGRHLGGDKPSKEVFLHLAMYRQRPGAGAVVHLHSTHCVAVACLADVNPDDALPPLTPYYIMRLGRCPVVPYFPPGDPALGEAVARVAAATNALLLANHGPVVSAKNLESAGYAAEELEETARLYLLLRGLPTRVLTPDQVAELKKRFPA